MRAIQNLTPESLRTHRYNKELRHLYLRINEEAHKNSIQNILCNHRLCHTSSHE